MKSSQLGSQGLILLTSQALEIQDFKEVFKDMRTDRPTDRQRVLVVEIICKFSDLNLIFAPFSLPPSQAQKKISMKSVNAGEEQGLSTSKKSRMLLSLMLLLA